jgi:uncharacterized protein (DUF2461 family)
VSLCVTTPLHPIASSSLTFFKTLRKEQQSRWFAENKDTYILAQNNIITFDQLIQLMSNHDALENVSGKKSLYRIYKDVRFSKDKSPTIDLQ